MSKKQSIEQFFDSQEVICKYIDYVKARGEKPEHHLARVLVNGNSNVKVLEVGVIIETNQSKVIICGDPEFCRDYHSKYTNIYHVFQSYTAGTLIIRDTEDVFGDDVVIELSYYK